MTDDSTREQAEVDPTEEDLEVADDDAAEVTGGGGASGGGGTGKIGVSDIVITKTTDQTSPS